jgi:hypothetical protein
MSYTGRESWEEYKNRLEKYGYTEEQISAIKEIRENYDLCPDEQFKELVKQGVVVRTKKLKRPRHYYVNDEGQFLYLDWFWKKMNVAGYFKTEE